MSIINFIADLPGELITDVESIFNKAEVAYKKLSPEIQANLKNGSAIWAAITAGLNATDITAKLGVSDADLLKVEQTIAGGFNLAIADTTDELTTTLEAYGKSLAPSIWPDISNAIADIGATVLNGGSPIIIGMNIVKYVYLDIVKPLFG